MQATTPRGFSADTEILTRRGWVAFPGLNDGDEAATRNPHSKAFEWQKPIDRAAHAYKGELIRFLSRGIDLLVTPDHQVLHTSGHAGIRCSELVKRADECEQLRSGAMIATSHWDAPDLEFVGMPRCQDHGYATISAERLKAARLNLGWSLARLAGKIGATKAYVAGMERSGRCHAASLPRIRIACSVLGLPEDEIIAPDPLGSISGDDFAAFIGAFVSEGCVSEYRKGNFQIYISQCRKSKGFEPYRQLLMRMLGREPFYDGRSWMFVHEGLGIYLRQCGHGAPAKRIPADVLSMSARQLRIFLDFYRLGDGWTCRYGSGEAFTTTSGVLAGQIQEVAQKIGLSASVKRREVKPAGTIRGRLIGSAQPRHDIFLRTTKRPKWTSTERVEYEGIVYRLSVPNDFVYVRRNSRAIWVPS